jgi:hypothetical protein
VARKRCMPRLGPVPLLFCWRQVVLKSTRRSGSAAFDEGHPIRITGSSGILDHHCPGGDAGATTAGRCARQDDALQETDTELQTIPPKVDTTRDGPLDGHAAVPGRARGEHG